MENIKEILKSVGIELSEENEKTFDEKFKENYKTIADYNKQKEKLDLASNQLSDTNKLFDDFKKNYEGVDVDDLKNQIATLTQTIADKDAEHSKKLSTLELKSKVEKALSEKNCIDLEVATSQLNLDELLASNNQDVDLSNAVETLAKNKSFLFKDESAKAKANLGGTLGGEPPKEESMHDVISQALFGK